MFLLRSIDFVLFYGITQLLKYYPCQSESSTSLFLEFRTSSFTLTIVRLLTIRLTARHVYLVVTEKHDHSSFFHNLPIKFSVEISRKVLPTKTSHCTDVTTQKYIFYEVRIVPPQPRPNFVPEFIKDLLRLNLNLILLHFSFFSEVLSLSVSVYPFITWRSSKTTTSTTL